MSDETDNTEVTATENGNGEEHKFFSDEIRARQKQQRKLAFLWPTLSFVFHLALFATIILLTPVREMIFSDSEKEEASSLSELSTEELERTVEEMEELRENEIASYLEDLQTILHNMEFMKNELLKDYDDFAEQTAEDIKPEMEKLFEEVLKNQEESLEHQQKSEAFIEEIVDIQEKVADEATNDAAIDAVNENEQDFKDAESAQATALNLLDVITANAEISGMENTLNATKLVLEKQQEVNELQAESKQLVWDMRQDNYKLEANLEEQKKEAEKYKNQFKPEQAKAEKNLEEKKAEKEKADQQLAQAEKERSDAEKQRNEANQKANQANNEFNQARNERNQAENDARNKDNEARNRERELNDAKNRTAKAERELESAKKAEAEKQQKSDKANEELAKAEQNKQEAEKNKDANKNALNDANNKLNEAKRAAENAKNELKRADELTNSRERELSNVQKNQQHTQEELAQAQAKLDEAKKAEAEKQQQSDKANQELTQAEKNKQEAEKNNNSSNNAFNDANNKLNNAKRSADQAKNELNHAKSHAQNKERELANAEKDQERRQETLNQAQARRDEAKQTLEEKKTKQAEKEQANKDAQQARNEAESKLRQENNELNAARNTQRNAQSQLSNAERDLNNRKNQVQRSEQYTKELEQRAQEYMKAAKDKAKLLDQKDDKVSKAQKETIELVKQVAKIASNESANPIPMADESMTSPESSIEMLTHLPLTEAYEKAKELEYEIAERSRDIKATELAISQNMALSQAIEMTDVATTIRPDFDKEMLESTPSTSQEFIEKREEMTKVVREAENIRNIAMSTMEDAQAIVSPEQYNGQYSSGSKSSREERLSRMYEFSSMENEIKAAGSEDSSQQAKDLTSLMSEAMARQSAQANATSLGASQSTSMSPTPGQQGAKGRPSRKPSGGRASSANTSQYIPQRKSAEDLTGVKGPSKISIPGGSAEGLGVPPLSRGMEGLVSGNFIGKAGLPAKWARIVNWYIVGPFANPNRSNITRVFPPETKVDLDATYIGKGGKPIKWEYNAFEQHGDEIRPWSQDQYGIWYAYTEVFMEEECDVWVAVGSDDRMDVWINDYKIWSSSNELKYWRINEGFRKVRMKKGRNKVLVRVENGWYVISWSMYITKENPE